MKKRIAVAATTVLFSATRAIHADVIDTFTRSDGPIAADSIGLTESATQKCAYSERFSPNGPDYTPVARIDNNQLRISGANTGSTALSQATSPGIVYLTGYNNANPTVSATVAFDSGTLNDASLITPGAAPGGSFLANRAGFILRAPPNLNFNTPNVASQQGFVEAEVGPNGDALIRELGSGNTLVSLFSGSLFGGGTTNQPHAGKLPAMLGGQPFDANQDGLLQPNEPFTLTVEIIPDIGNGQSGLSLYINGVDLEDKALAFHGAASGINGVGLLRNRSGSTATFSVATDVLMDNLDLTPPGTTLTVTSTWNVDSDGSWTNGSNWSNGSPFAVDAVANFGTVTTASRTVTLDGSQVVGTINFDNLNGYTLSAATSGSITTNLILSTSTGAAAISVASGNQTIAAPVEIKANTTISVASASSLTITGTVLGTGRTLTKAGSGAVQFGAVKVGTLAISAGAATITPKAASNTAAGTSVVGALSIPSGQALDLTNNDLILDYSNGGVADPAQTAFIRSLIRTGYAGGAWTGKGLTSSSAAAVAADTNNLHKSALGYAEASAASLGTFDGITVDHDAILVRYTYFGDANLNGTVDTTDFTLLANNFNQTGAGWVNGDFNYDGVVNALDFNMLAIEFGATGASPAPTLGSLVPEPVSVGLLGISLAALRLRRRRS